ncbi:glycosyltransferase family 1 protein [Oculatella sp. LEGE 06141]|uniref:glycosyltransferase n=1 Tax=Oculatella sp. LEGE 06141 TaxID=1828648 RepID=UPI00187E2DBC|nr:glycosyltransferase [Oculatella sp. LEGE 06141]MBE9181921.1 glycosyltransferase family 1 protein [Oculatella sp. LEGE 06141]
MATLLITVPDFTSHVLPILPIAAALVKRDHRVLVHTSQQHQDKVEAIGAELVPMSEQCDIKFQTENCSVPRPWWFPAVANGLWRFRHGVLAMVPVMMAELETIVKREQVDCLIGDYIGYGASYAAERLGIPFITITVSWTVTPNADAVPSFLAALPLPPRLIHAAIDFIFPLRRVRQQMGLPPRPKSAPAEFISIIVSKLLNVVTAHRDFIPATDLQENQVFIGPTAFQMPHASDDPYGASLEPGTVLVSTTTSSTADDGQFRLVLESVAQMGFPVLATSGNATDIPSDLGENVRLETFVPFDQVLPYVKAMVTHGGAGSVGRAFRMGVPMLIISDFGDQIATGSRAADLGLAYHLPKNKVTPKAIQSKLNALLQDQALHNRVKALSEQLRSMDSPELGADAIERTLQHSMTRSAIQPTHAARLASTVSS